MSSLPEEKKATLIEELERYIEQMHNLESTTIGVLLGDIIMPYHIEHFYPEPLKLFDAEQPIFVFCHNDLSQYNVIVDEEILKTEAILSWEYSGFFPVEFDGNFHLRKGSSDAIEGEESDVGKLLLFIDAWKDDEC